MVSRYQCVYRAACLDETLHRSQIKFRRASLISLGSPVAVEVHQRRVRLMCALMGLFYPRTRKCPT